MCPVRSLVQVTDIVLYDAPSPMNSLSIPDSWPAFSLSFQPPSFGFRLPLPSTSLLPRFPRNLSVPLRNYYDQLGRGIYRAFVTLVILRKIFRRCLLWRAKGLEVLVYHFLPRTVHPSDRRRICE